MIVRGKKLYEEFMDDMASDIINRDDNGVDAESDAVIGATHTISIVVNEIPKTSYKRLEPENYKKALKKFDRLLVNALMRYPQISEVGPRIYNTDNPRFNAIRNQTERDDEYGLTYRPSFDMSPSFKVEVDVIMEVNGPSFINFIISLYKTFNNVAEMAFPGSAAKKYGIDPIDLTSGHGMEIWDKKYQDIIDRKNDNATKTFVKNFARQITGGKDNFRKYVDRYFSENRYDPHLYTILNMVRLKTSDVIIGKADNGVYFVDVPKGKTLLVDQKYKADNIRYEVEKMDGSVFFTVDGTLDIRSEYIVCEPIKWFMDNLVSKTIKDMKITIGNPYEENPGGFDPDNILDLTMFFIDRLHVVFKKRELMYGEKYTQPVIRYLHKPKEIEIKDFN